MNKDVNISYEKSYTDDLGKHIPNIFNDKHITIKTYWERAIDAFYSFNCYNYFTCLTGDVRIVTASDEGNENWRFSQYYLSGMDGKIIKVKTETVFGIHNIGNSKATLMSATDTDLVQFDRLSAKIFNWRSKRS